MGSSWATPFLDVFFLILAAILFSNPSFQEVQQVAVEIPSVSGGDGPIQYSAKSFELSLDQKGDIYVEGELRTVAQICELAQASFNEGAQDVRLNADQAAAIGDYVELLQILKKAGFHTVRLPVTKTERRD